MPMRIDHINIAAPFDLLEKVRVFYCDVLGLKDGSRPAFSDRGFWLYSDDRPLVHLSERNDRQATLQPGHLDHIAFQSSGLGAMKDRLAGHGIDYRSGYIAEFNMTQLFFKDPAGTGLEINFPGES
jgi:catechol 2,3-dioxygenase-like lactoylglutathione lyase family enzyme